MKVDISKQYRTKGGYRVTFLPIKLKGQAYPVAGAVHYPNIEAVELWSDEGIARNNGSNDLVEVTPYDNFKCNDEVFARSIGESNWWPAHFAYLGDTGSPYVYEGGRSKFTTRYRGDVRVVAELRTPEEHFAASGC